MYQTRNASRNASCSNVPNTRKATGRPTTSGASADPEGALEQQSVNNRQVNQGI